MYRTVQMVLAGILVVTLGLAALSRRFPQVGWLQAFRYNFPRLSEERQARIRRSSNIHAGIELILLGVILPLIYFASSLMMFNEPTTKGTVLVGAGSVLLIGLGVTAIWRNRRG